MKKYFSITAILLFVAGIAFAQNNQATVDQDGNANEAMIEQIGNLNQATVDQDGYEINADIYQSGTSNQAIAIQSTDGLLLEGVSANIHQEGIQNIAEVDYQNDITDNRNTLADIQQYGNENKAYVQQSNHGGEVYILQDGYNNLARVRQHGNYDNHVDIAQYGDNNIVANASLGNNNEISLQEGVKARNHRSEINIIQDGIEGGIGNRVGFNQRGWQTADISQFGDNNETLLYQDGGYHTSTVIQTGNDNNATILQLDLP